MGISKICEEAVANRGGGGVETPPSPKFRRPSNYLGCFTLAMTNKLVVIINSLKIPKLRKFYYMKWNFLYQITAASRTPDYGATAFRSPFCLSSTEFIELPRIKFLGTSLRGSIPADSSWTMNIKKKHSRILERPWRFWTSHCYYKSRHRSACGAVGRQIYSSFLLRPFILFDQFSSNCN